MSATAQFWIMAALTVLAIGVPLIVGAISNSKNKILEAEQKLVTQKLDTLTDSVKRVEGGVAIQGDKIEGLSIQIGKIEGRMQRAGWSQ